MAKGAVLPKQHIPLTPGTVDRPRLLDRLERVIELQMRHSEERLDAMIGREEEILIEGTSSRDDREWMGKTRCFKKVIVPAAPGAARGAFVRARIQERRGLVLRGEIVPPSRSPA